MSAAKAFARSVAVSVTTYAVVSGVIFGGRKMKEKYDERKQKQNVAKVNAQRADDYTITRTR